MKAVKVEVSKAVLAEFFIQSERAYQVSKGLPPSAELVRVKYDTKSGNYILLFKDDSFEDILFGGSIPVLPSDAIVYTAWGIVRNPEPEGGQEGPSTKPQADNQDQSVEKPKIKVVSSIPRKL